MALSESPTVGEAPGSSKKKKNKRIKITGEEEGKSSGEESIIDETVAMTPVSSSLVRTVGELEQVSRLVEDGLLPLDSEARGVSGQLIGDGDGFHLTRTWTAGKCFLLCCRRRG